MEIKVSLGSSSTETQHQQGSLKAIPVYLEV